MKFIIVMQEMRLPNGLPKEFEILINTEEIRAIRPVQGRSFMSEIEFKNDKTAIVAGTVRGLGEAIRDEEEK